MKAFTFKQRQTREAANCEIFDLHGYIDAHTVLDFEKAVNNAIDTGTHRVILDIGNLSYISSAGIGAIMGLARKLTQAGGDLVLLRPTQKVYAILEGLGFTKIFKIAADENEALLKLTGGNGAR